MQSNQDANSTIQRAIDALKSNQITSAYKEVEHLRERGIVVRDVNHIRAICLAEMNRPKEALDAISHELHRFPDNQGAQLLKVELERIYNDSSVHHQSVSSSEQATQAINNTASSVNLNQLNAMAAEAIQLVHSGKGVEALRKAEEIARISPTTPGVHFLRVFCLNTVGRHEEALVAAKQELEINPGHEGARKEVERLTKAIAKRLRPQLHPEQRAYGSTLARDTMLDIQNASHNYTYRGVPIIKNPFDWAIYPILLWDIKPRTIIEIGSKNGGSALWLGDMLNNYGIDGQIYSLDIVKVTEVSHPRVTFMEANGRNLGATLSKQFMDSLPRPLLVIEDADHSFETSYGVLNFFKDQMKEGEYIVIEDGIISDMENDPNFNSGPHRALKQFFSERPGEYDIDSKYADYFGYNLTWCTNGFLRCKGTKPNPNVPKTEITQFLKSDVETLGLRTDLGINDRFAIHEAMREVRASSPTIISIGENADGVSALAQLSLRAIGVTSKREVITSSDLTVLDIKGVEIPPPARVTKVPCTKGYVPAGGQYDVVLVESDRSPIEIATAYQGVVKSGGLLVITSPKIAQFEMQNREWERVQSTPLFNGVRSDDSAFRAIVLKRI